MRELDFLGDIAILKCSYEDLKKIRKIIEETNEEIYEDFLDNLKEASSVRSDISIDPVAIAYEIILHQVEEELDDLIEDAIDWYLSQNNENDDLDYDYEDLLWEYGKAIEDIHVYGNFSDTKYDSYDNMLIFLDKIDFKNYLLSNVISISKTLNFFLDEIGL